MNVGRASRLAELRRLCEGILHNLSAKVPAERLQSWPQEAT